MDFQQLFDDLTGQLEEELDRERACEREDELRQQQAKLSLMDRLRFLMEQNKTTPQLIELNVRGGYDLFAFVQSGGKDWILAEVEAPELWRGSILIPMASVISIRFPVDAVDASLGEEPSGDSSNDDSQGNRPPQLSTQIGFGFILRDLARRRSSVKIVAGERQFSGPINRVGRDHLEVVSEKPGLSNEITLIALSDVNFVSLD